MPNSLSESPTAKHTTIKYRRPNFNSLLPFNEHDYECFPCSKPVWKECVDSFEEKSQRKATAVTHVIIWKAIFGKRLQGSSSLSRKFNTSSGETHALSVMHLKDKVYIAEECVRVWHQPLNLLSLSATSLRISKHHCHGRKQSCRKCLQYTPTCQSNDAARIRFSVISPVSSQLLSSLRQVSMNVTRLHGASH